ncbi:MAG TPA: DUF2232 domain-containing protein [Thermoanaerobaculia bacterium]|nr:DUF2232 domain-containing protein [Thermoanaerobaculia bacterium]
MATDLPGEQVTPRPPEPRSGVREILLAGFLSTMLFSAFIALPIIGMATLPFLAVPPVRLAFRRGGIAGVSAALLATGVLLGLGLATGGSSDAVAFALFAAVMTGLPPLFASFVAKGQNPSLVYLVLCVSGFLVLAAILALRPAAGGHTMPQEISAAFDQMTPAAVASYNRGGMDAESVARLKTLLASTRDFASKFWVGLVGVMWILSAGIGFYTGARLARPAPPAEATRFDGLSLPPAVVVLFVASGAGAVLAAEPAKGIAGNALLPLSALYFLAGLSIICHFARKWFRARILRVGLYGLALYFPINVGVGLLGLFDWYADFRHRGEKA